MIICDDQRTALFSGNEWGIHTDQTNNAMQIKRSSWLPFWGTMLKRVQIVKTNMEVRLKRVYDPESPGDGFRVLVDKLWPHVQDDEKPKNCFGFFREIGNKIKKLH